jgi:acetylornithine deacetylase/succinyl-diaminopimelate desuccinylase family protein
MPHPPVIETLADLVRINSVNSSYDCGPGEREIATFVRRFFEGRGVEVWEQEVFPDRPNVLARLPGRDSSRCLVLEAHTDTVSVKGMALPPFEARLEAGRMFGRGSCDTKGGLAAMMHAVASLKENRITPPCDVLLAAVADEEFSYRGVVKLCEGLQADAAIVAEPTELRCVIATKGVIRWRIRVRGKAAHSSRPQLGVNAISHMSRIVLALEEDHGRLAMRPHPLLGPATCNVGVIHGGVQVNFVPDECVIEIDRRLLPGERTGDVLRRYQGIIDDLKARFPGLEAEMETPMLTDEALETPGDAAVVNTACAVLRDMGLNDETCGVPFGCDASKLSRAGIPSIVFGPGSIDRAHAAVEYVEIDQVEKALEFYRRFLIGFGS